MSEKPTNVTRWQSGWLRTAVRMSRLRRFHRHTVFLPAKKTSLLFAGGLVLLSALLLPLTAAAGSYCENDARAIGGPLQVSLTDGGRGTGAELCPVSAIWFGGHGRAIVAPEDFYGNIVASAGIGGSYALGANTAVFASFDPARYQLVISSISAATSGTGTVTLGATHRLKSEWGLLGRLTAPTGPEYRNATPLGADLMLLYESMYSPDLGVHGHLGILGEVAISGARTDPRLNTVAATGASYMLASWCKIVAEARASATVTGAVDHISAALGLVVESVNGNGVELGAEIPLAGRNRTLAAISLRLFSKL